MSAEVQRTTTFDAPTAETVGHIDLDTPVLRYAGNPILTCHDVNRAWAAPGLKVKTVHNAGVARYRGEVLMLFRSHLR